MDGSIDRSVGWDEIELVESNRIEYALVHTTSKDPRRRNEVDDDTSPRREVGGYCCNVMVMDDGVESWWISSLQKGSDSPN